MNVLSTQELLSHAWFGIIGLMLDVLMRLLERLKFVRWRYVR